MSYEQRDKNTFRKHDLFLNKMSSTKNDACLPVAISGEGDIFLRRKTILWYIVVNSFLFNSFDKDREKGRNTSSSYQMKRCKKN